MAVNFSKYFVELTVRKIYFCETRSGHAIAYLRTEHSDPNGEDKAEFLLFADRALQYAMTSLIWSSLDLERNELLLYAPLSCKRKHCNTARISTERRQRIVPHLSVIFD